MGRVLACHLDPDYGELGEPCDMGVGRQDFTINRGVSGYTESFIYINSEEEMDMVLVHNTEGVRISPGINV